MGYSIILKCGLHASQVMHCNSCNAHMHSYYVVATQLMPYSKSFLLLYYELFMQMRLKMFELMIRVGKGHQIITTALQSSIAILYRLQLVDTDKCEPRV